MRHNEQETINLLTYLLWEKKPFCHVRFGDGDVFFATGTGSKITADGEEWSRDLQLDLLTAWDRCMTTNHRLLVGDINSYIASDGCEHEWDVIRRYGEYRRGQPLELVHIEALRCGLGYSAPLYAAIADDPRRKVYFAPERLRPAAEMLGAELIPVPLHVAWKEIATSILQKLYVGLPFGLDMIVLISAGRGGKILQEKLCHDQHPWTQIDIGSGLDLLFTDLRRSTDLGINVEEIREQFRAEGLSV